MNMPSARKHVFLSSTYSDLIDLRSELLHHLSSLGLRVLTSSGTSIDSRNSIETSLSNLRACDFAIFVLSQNYGNNLEGVGYGNVSLIHLEYREAVRASKDVLVYVRNHLEGDFNLWKKGNPLEWVAEKDSGLFTLLNEHHDRDLSYRVFDNSFSLKELLTNDLEVPVTQMTVERAIRDNIIPIIKIEALLQHKESAKGTHAELHCNYKNVGTVPAYNVAVECFDKGTSAVFRGDVNPVIAPNEGSRLVSVLDSKAVFTDIIRKFVIRYQAPDGFVIKDTFLFTCTTDKSGNVSTMLRQSGRSYSFSDQKPYILDVSS